MNLRLATLLAAVALASPAAGADRLPGPIRAELVHVYDGDTVKVRARIWLDQEITVWVRLRGIDTPEIGRGAACDDERRQGLAARDELRRLLAGRAIELADIGPDKYAGRVDARVTAGGVDVASVLVAAGLGRPYEGGRRRRWC